MKDRQELAARFSYAHRVWLATVHLRIHRDKNYVQSRALVRTTSGMADKRDIVAFCSHRGYSAKRGVRVSEALVALTAVCASTAIALFLILRALNG